MSQTFNALIGKGIDSEKANKIIRNGLTIEQLATCSHDTLNEIGLNKNDLDLIFRSKRPPIPDEIVNSLLYKSRKTCCVCREREKAIIIHHIVEWNKSKSHSEDNLVVLCLVHHDEAHSKKELSLNLTPNRIRAAKEKWELEVQKHDNVILSLTYKELLAIPKQLSKLKEKWFNFLQKLDMKIEQSDTPRYDFKIHGITTLVVKVYEISDIKELDKKEVLIQKADEDTFFDNLIILGNGPFLSNNGFYGNEINIQIGWVYSHGAQEWDHVMLKEGYDISNSIFYIENFLYPHTSYKIFLTDDDFPDIKKVWEKS